jgi:aspartate aminotransferase
VLAGSASKSYAMTGWRCGWTIAPKALTAAFNVIQGQSTSNIASITQKAALAAVTGPQDAVSDDARRVPAPPRQHPRLAHRAPGHPVREAEGRLLPVPDISGLLSIGRHRDVGRFRAGAHREGARRGHGRRGLRCAGYLRISYATSMEQLREGATRILRFAESLQPAKVDASG